MKTLVVFGGVMVVVLSLDPRFAGSNPVDSDGFLRAIKIRCTISFGRKQSHQPVFLYNMFKTT
jgi:hypothetical protein